jgi:methylamine dehydrogenase heavy chain
MSRRSGTLLFLLVAIATLAAAAARAQIPPDEMTSKTLPAPAPNWVFVLDAGFPSTNIAKIDVIDGNTRKMLGQLTGGYLANFEISPDHREMYTIDTYYSRGWRGTRTDVVSIFDAKALTFEAEVEIPPKRILIVPKRDTARVTPDGRFMLIANMTPATSVSVVDLKARKFAGEIDTPGCVQVIAPGNRQFSSMCADGSILTVQLDDAGAAKGKQQGKPFFDPNTDPVFDQPAVVGSKAYFDSYHGAIHVLDLSGADAMPRAGWSVYAPGTVVTPGFFTHSAPLDIPAKEKEWRPGGWQTIAYNEKRDLLFVLMHQGGEWTHKQFGTEVWLFDAAKQARVRRIKLKTPAYSIYVSNSDNPILYALSLLKSQLDEYAVPDGKHLGSIDQLGTPFLVQGP